ncbi:MAG: VTT domain-containing protein [Candidatus Paceibacterota bacterium]
MLPAWTSNYFFAALFVGMLTAGEIVLIPGVYLGYISNLGLLSILGVALLGSIASDTFWYCAGRCFPHKSLKKSTLIKREMERAKKLRPFYDKHKLRMIFYSKFLFGTTVFFQVLAGANHVPYRHYLLASTGATIVWFLIATVFGVVLGTSVGALSDIVIGIEIIASITLATVILTYAAVYWHLKRKLSYSRASR